MDLHGQFRVIFVQVAFGELDVGDMATQEFLDFFSGHGEIDLRPSNNGHGHADHDPRAYPRGDRRKLPGLHAAVDLNPRPRCLLGILAATTKPLIR